MDKPPQVFVFLFACALGWNIAEPRKRLADAALARLEGKGQGEK